MTTVLAVYTSERCVGRCDANCHDAVTSDCDCICGGRNHGVGTAAAIANTTERLEQMTGGAALRIFEAVHGVGATRIDAMPDVTQLGLDIGGEGT